MTLAQPGTASTQKSAAYEPTNRTNDGSGPLAVAKIGFRAVLAYPVSFLLTAAVAFFLGLWVLAHIPKSYDATAIITPPMELDRLGASTNLSGSSGGLGGLGGLFGVGSQSTSLVRYQTFVTLLSSRRVAQQLIAKHNALVLIFPKSWDAAHNTWKRPQGTIAAWRQDFSQAMGYPGWMPPDASTLAKYLAVHLKVSESLKTTERTLTFTASDPLIAAQLLRWTMEESDAAVRADAIDRAKAQLDYVEAQLAKSLTNSEDREVLAEILMSTERSMLMASTGSSFASEVIQQPETSPAPTSPPLFKSILVIMVISLGAGVGVSLLRSRR